MNTKLQLFAVIAILFSAGARAQPIQKSYSWDNLPKVERPVFTKDSFLVTKYGATGDGITLNTKSINQAINDCSSHGGGVVVIPQGVYISGPIKLKNNVNLHLSRSAILQFTEDKSQYGLIEGSYEGRKAIRNESPISGENLENIAITGDGIVDGHGEVWRAMTKDRVTESEWKSLIQNGVVSADGRAWYPSESYVKGSKSTTYIEKGKTLNDYVAGKDFYRPNLLVLTNCKKVLLANTTFQNSPAWCLHLILCENLTFDAVKIKNAANAQNGDGMDIESCSNVLVENSTLSCGDDAICIKSGKDEEGRKRGVPTKNVIVRNNVVYSGHGGFVIGSEMSGGAHDIFVTDCSFIGTDNGLRFKTARGRGGVVENIFIKNISMSNILRDAVLFDMYYVVKAPNLSQTNGKVEIPPVDDGTPRFRNFYIENLVCDGAERAILIRGLPEMSILNINLKDVKIKSSKGADIVEAENITFKNIQLQCKAGSPMINIENSRKIVFDRLYPGGDSNQIFSINGDRTASISILNSKLENVKQLASFNYGALPSTLIRSK